MIRETIEILNRQGLNSRPAIAFLKESSKFKSDILLIKDGNKYNGKSILGILSMGAFKGDKLEIVVDGEDEEVAMNSILSFFESLRD